MMNFVQQHKRIFAILFCLTIVSCKKEDSSTPRSDSVAIRHPTHQDSVLKTPDSAKQSMLPTSIHYLSLRGSQKAQQRVKRRLVDASAAGSPEGEDSVALDSVTYGYLFETQGVGAHCCSILFLAIGNPAGSNTVDSLWIGDGEVDFRVRNLRGDGRYDVLIRLIHFPYSYATAYSDHGDDLSIYLLTKTGFVNDTRNFPNLIEPEIRRMDRNVSRIKSSIGKTSDLGELKEELACLLYAYSSIDREAAGSRAVERYYDYDDSGSFLPELKETVEYEIKNGKTVPPDH
jgi:hypothetical protein